MDAFTFLPDTACKRPLYDQLYRALAGEIKSGAIAPGERLPSKRALSAQLRLSQSTVETAYSMLLAEGYIQSRPRSGYFACAVEAPLAPEEAPCPPPSASVLPEDTALHFSTGAVDTRAFPYATWAKITKSVVYGTSDLLLRGEAQGDEALRRTLAKTLHEMRGVRCRPEQIVIGAGIEYLLDLVVQLLGRSAVYALENPGYLKTLELMRNHQSEVRMIPVDQQGMSAAHLMESDATAAYITPSHQFPLGVTMPVGRRMQLLGWAARTGAYIIEDDYDSEFRYGMRPIPALQGFDAYGRVVYLGTFSRSIAPSIRAAYLVLPESLLPLYREKFRFYSSTVSRIEQHTLARFIGEGHFARHLNRMTLLYKRKRELLIRALSVQPFGQNMQVRGERAGLHFLITLALGLSEAELVARARAHGVRLHGLSEYCAPGCESGEATLVLGYAGLSDEEIVRAAALLGEAWT